MEGIYDYYIFSNPLPASGGPISLSRRQQRNGGKKMPCPSLIPPFWLGGENPHTRLGFSPSDVRLYKQPGISGKGIPGIFFGFLYADVNLLLSSYVFCNYGI
jgi:hypothetical protein